MTNMFLRAGSALALLFAAPGAMAQQAAPAPAAAVETKDADPALWVVKDDDTTIYLFGTIHVLRPGLSWFDEAVKKAFDSSGELVTEIGAMPEDPAAVMPLILKYGYNATGPTLTERLPADKRAAFAKAVADLGLPLDRIDRLDPWMAGVQIGMLSVAKLGYVGESGAEQALQKAAKAAGKPVSGLETMEDQFRIFDSVSEKTQVDYLVETVEKLGEAETALGDMISKWAQGDADGFAAIINKGFATSPELTQKLLIDRNLRWTDWIQTRLDKPGVVFVAVGAGHLAGNESVQTYLAKRKIKATRINY